MPPRTRRQVYQQDQIKDAETFTAGSLEAAPNTFRRRTFNGGRYTEALDGYKALQLTRNSAARTGLSAVSNSLGRQAEAADYKQALDLIDRMTDH